MSMTSWLEECRRADAADVERHELLCLLAALSAIPEAVECIRGQCAIFGIPAALLRDARDGAEWAQELLPIGVARGRHAVIR